MTNAIARLTPLNARSSATPFATPRPRAGPSCAKPSSTTLGAYHTGW